VGGQAVAVQTSGGLRLRRLVAEDGAEANLGVTLADGTACTLQRDGSCVAEQAPGREQVCGRPRSAQAQSGATLLEVGAGPLHLEVFELRGVTGTFRLPAGGFTAEDGSSCNIWEAVDGSLRCVNDADEVDEADFSDCTYQHRLYRAREAGRWPADPDALQSLRFIARGFNAGSAAYRIQSVSSLKPHEGGAYYPQNDRCNVGSGDGLLALDRELSIDSLPLIVSTRL
jgi:hypothetical protein